MIVLMGKTASGKNLIRDKLVNNYGYKSIVTYTTRPMRPGEIQDVTYHFISDEDFYNKINSNFFAEWKVYQTVNGKWYYGSAAQDYVQDGVIILTPSGVKDIIDSGINATIVLIDSSEDTIRKRLIYRGDDATEANRRIEADLLDFNNAEMLADIIVNNDYNANIDEIVENIHKEYIKEVVI